MRASFVSVETSQEPDVNVKSNEAYGVSGGVGQSEEMDCEYSVVVTHEAHGAETTEIRPIQGTNYIVQVTYNICK